MSNPTPGLTATPTPLECWQIERDVMNEQLRRVNEAIESGTLSAQERNRAHDEQEFLKPMIALLDERIEEGLANFEALEPLTLDADVVDAESYIWNQPKTGLRAMNEETFNFLFADLPWPELSEVEQAPAWDEREPELAAKYPTLNAVLDSALPYAAAAFQMGCAA